MAEVLIITHLTRKADKMGAISKKASFAYMMDRQ